MLKLRPRSEAGRSKAYIPLWPDDQMKVHPDSPYETAFSEEAIRAMVTLTGVSRLGPRMVEVTPHGALTVAPEIGNFLRSQEGNLNDVTGATVAIGDPPARSLFIANDDPANAITFQVANKMNGAKTAPDFSQATTQTIPAGSSPIAIDVTAYGVNFPATGNASAYRCWWIS